MVRERIDKAEAWNRIDRILRENAAGGASAADVCAAGFALQTLVDPESHCCCDELRGCPACFARAEELIGKRVRDSYDRVWEVTHVGEKDGFPTIAGATWWARPDEAVVLGG